ncbi:hypothetical protein MH928_04755 [Flavobacterium sp. WW92]|uniref:hypothetical protein n=1 Tax=unclassified Flavobacterium TaxID=196869 RepID=UPI002224DE7E|nr:MULTISPECIES: hypothetical protein [unclassified Flavobacterium]WDO14008.1 hypothetical protein MH928_04755 [Flavobacterium sp. WW92]
MENQVYNWLVKKGTIRIQRNGDCIALQLDYEKEDYCLLTPSDTDEIIELLTNISKQIWEDPDYKRKPYTNPLYKKIGNEYYWEIETSRLLLHYNETEDAVEIKCNGNSSLNLEINYVVEIIQILEYLNK